MKTNQMIKLHWFWVILAVCGLAFFATPAQSRAQVIGPVVDVCTSGSVSYAEETVCFYGNISTPGQQTARATASAYLTECCYLSAIGVDLQLLDNGNQVADTGTPGSTYESVSITPNADVYTAVGWIDACYGSPDSCYWEDHTYSTSAEAGLSAVVNPYYKVTSIVYDTPGNRGQSGFATSTTDGTHTSVGGNFTQGSSTTYSSGGGYLGFGGTISVNFGQSVTRGYSTQETDTFTQGTSVANVSAANPINHSQDMFLIWLNPSVSITSSGQYSALFSTGTQSVGSGNPEPVDHVITFANELQGSNGKSSLFPYQLTMQYDPATGNYDLPGMAAYCANLNVSEYQAAQCTFDDQCGCKSSDFSEILAQDPLLGYGPTESPLDADTSGSGSCGQLPSPPSNSKCRYLPVVDSQGYQQATTLQGPSCQGCNLPGNSGSFTDQYMKNVEYSESSTQTVGYSWKLEYPIGSFQNGSSWQWTSSESSGPINGYANTMNYTIETNSVGCFENVNVFYDTVYHTYVFQNVGDNGLCQ